MNLKSLILICLTAGSLSGCVTITLEHKPGKTVIRSQGKSKSDQKTIEIEQEFVQKIWQKAEVTVGVYNSMPLTEFRPYDQYNNDIYRYIYGRGCSTWDLPDHFVGVGSAISINYEELMRNIFYYDSKTMQIFVYNVIAHEFLHCLYNHKINLIRDPKERKRYKNSNQHCEMMRTGNLKELAQFIDEQLGGDGDAKEYSLNITNSACYRSR